MSSKWRTQKPRLAMKWKWEAATAAGGRFWPAGPLPTGSRLTYLKCRISRQDEYEYEYKYTAESVFQYSRYIDNCVETLNCLPSIEISMRLADELYSKSVSVALTLHLFHAAYCSLAGWKFWNHNVISRWKGSTDSIFGEPDCPKGFNSVLPPPSVPIQRERLHFSIGANEWASF